MGRDFDNLMPAERAMLAQQALANPVFVHVLHEEIRVSTDVAINSNSEADRESHRFNVIWLNHLIKQIKQFIEVQNG